MGERAIHVVCVNQYYWPDVAATGQLLTDLAEDLAGSGMGVTVLAGRSAYAGTARPPAREERNGVSIRRCGGTGFGRGKVPGILADYLTFFASATWAMLRVPRPSLFFAETTPPLIVFAALVVSRLRGVPLVHLVQDLYPDVAEALGALRPGGVLAGLFRRIQRFCLKRASRVVVLGEDMKEKVLAYGVADERVEVIPNWADLRELAADPDEVRSLREAWGLAGKKVVMYSGNLGRAHTFGEMLDAARDLRGRPDIVFLFVGGGNQWEAVRGQAESEGLENVRFRPYTERGRLGASLGVGDVHLITQKLETEGLLVPCKLYGILAAGKPVVFVGSRRSEVARTLASCGAGTTVPPGDGAGLAGAIVSSLDDPSAVEKGAGGRAWMSSVGDRPHRTGQYRKLFVDVARARS